MPTHTHINKFSIRAWRQAILKGIICTAGKINFQFSERPCVGAIRKKIIDKDTGYPALT